MADSFPIAADSWLPRSPRLAQPPRAKRAPLGSRLWAFGENCQRNGVAAAVAGSVYRVATRVFKLRIGHVLSLELAQVQPQSSDAADLDYRFLTAAEIGEFAADPRNDLDPAMALRLQSDRDFCFAAFAGPRLVNYSWYALEAIEPEHSLGVGLSMPSDTIYLYKAFTHPDDRGRGTHRAALSLAASQFAARGIVRLIALVEYGNWASLRSHRKLGCRSVGCVFKLGSHLFNLPRQRRAVAVPGLRFGSASDWTNE